MSSSPLNLMTLQETLELLGVSRATLDRWRQLKGLPFIKIGKEVLFDRDDLQSWVRRQAGARAAASPQGPCPEGEGPLTLTVGYQSGTAHMWSSLLIKSLRLFEEELSLLRPYRSITVRWHDAANGLELVEGLISGAVRIAALGDYPIAMSGAFSRVLPKFRSVLLAFDGKTPRGRGIAVAVPQGHPARSLSDLAAAGTISTVPHSSAGHRLRGLLASLSGGQPQVQVIHQEMPDSLRSIAQRSIGASVMWEPYPSLIDHFGQGRLLLNDGLGEDYLTGMVADESWADANGDIVVAYLKAHLKAHRFIRDEPAGAARLVSRATGVPLRVAAQVLSRVRWDAAVYARDLETLQSFSAESPLPLHGGPAAAGGLAFRSDYLQEAAHELRLPSLQGKPLSGAWSRELLY